MMVCKQTEVSNMKIKDEQKHQYCRIALLSIINRLYISMFSNSLCNKVSQNIDKIYWKLVKKFSMHAKKIFVKYLT